MRTYLHFVGVSFHKAQYPDLHAAWITAVVLGESAEQQLIDLDLVDSFTSRTLRM